MVIQSLKLKDFRNYGLLDLEFDPLTNIFYGDNAQGKTNILEALYLGGTTRSHRGTKDKDIIMFDNDESHVEMNVSRGGTKYCIDIHLKKNEPKGAAVNKIPIHKASELFKIVNFVFFSPEDLNIIKNSPAERRKFIDTELCQLDSVYLHDLIDYNHIIVQRNKLLKELVFRPELLSTLDIWDEQLIQYGNKIINRRNIFIQNLSEILYNIHKNLTGGKEQLEVLYEPSVLEGNFNAELARTRERDRKVCTTSVGPHRDDLAFLSNGIDLRTFGSQGQQRTAALSLKLAEIELIRSLVHDTPVLLLDDVLSELDQNRQEYLLNSIHDIQTMITCTGLDEFVNHRFHVNRIFKVAGGTVVKEN